MTNVGLNIDLAKFILVQIISILNCLTITTKTMPNSTINMQFELIERWD